MPLIFKTNFFSGKKINLYYFCHTTKKIYKIINMGLGKDQIMKYLQKWNNYLIVL